MFGDSLLWKNAQNIDTNNIISDMMNRIIPIFILLVTLMVCIPWNVASRMVSRHHWIIVKIMIIIPIIIKVGLFL